MREPGSELAELAGRELLRHVRNLDGANGARVVLDGRELLNFSSNDYLGLAGSEPLREAACRAVDAHGTSAVASRLIYGGGPEHQVLERALAVFFQKDKALSFANGYTAAAGVLPAVLKKGDTAILDKRCHACLIDGATLSGATVRVFPHNGMAKLERLLASAAARADGSQRTLVISESVFSMDGDLCDLDRIVQLKKRYGALLLLDEAHAFGVLGPSGRGLAHREGLAGEVDFLMATFGKAAASAGGCVAATSDWVDLIANRARSFIYSTAPPPAQPAASAAALALISSEEGDARRERLQQNASRLASALSLPHPDSAIVPIIIGGERNALEASEQLLEQGFLIPAIRYPTVARGKARLRVSLSAAHRAEDIDRLARAILAL